MLFRSPARRFGSREQADSQPSNGETEVLRIPLDDNKVWLKIRYVFTPQNDDTCGPDKAFMSYSLDGTNWTEVDSQLQMRFSLDLFTGYKTMLYNYATSQTGGYADFDYFRQSVY